MIMDEIHFSHEALGHFMKETNAMKILKELSNNDLHKIFHCPPLYYGV